MHNVIRAYARYVVKAVGIPTLWTRNGPLGREWNDLGSLRQCAPFLLHKTCPFLFYFFLTGLSSLFGTTALQPLSLTKRITCCFQFPQAGREAALNIVGVSLRWRRNIRPIAKPSQESLPARTAPRRPQVPVTNGAASYTLNPLGGDVKKATETSETTVCAGSVNVAPRNSPYPHAAVLSYRCLWTIITFHNGFEGKTETRKPERQPFVPLLNRDEWENKVNGKKKRQKQKKGEKK